MRSIIIITVITLFMVVMDLYAFRGIHHLLGMAPQNRSFFTFIYWGVSLGMLGALIWAGSRFQQMRDPSLFFGVTVIMGIFLMLYIPKLFFNMTQLLSDTSGLVIRLVQDRENRIRNWFLVPGAIIGMLLFVSFGMGMIHGRTHVKVFREQVGIEALPLSFNGLKIVQLSDIHLAGFYKHPDHIRKVVEQVNRLEPDLILFTGDMFHNFSEEMDPFITILDQLSAPLGKFAVLGNHDYGHYYDWESQKEEEDNLDRVKDQIRAAGFDLLLNEHRSISLNGDSLVIVGVENWGKPPFPQVGDLSKALDGSAPGLVKILMSHDPSHWDLKVKGKEEIALTLSGHTHGMQFGIEIGKIKWSPSQWTYKQWGGLYRENGQYLYVNRGLGYTGFPGRVGIRPEITLITLENKSNYES